MDPLVNEINSFLVTIFNDVLMIEEKTLQSSRFKDVSIKEMHTIEAVGMYHQHTTSEVAKKLGVTAGTLTVSVNNLVRKGYVERIRTDSDRRVVKLALTPNGRLLYRLHDKFHRDMVKETIAEMDKEQSEILMIGLRNLHEFLERTKEQLPE
ncbi:fatty acid biosynthesis transcriptional regulator FabT [Marinilactibacillus psychrotolerans]|uniref:MarR family transcriptional regulator n=3 Tax=Marinilactibacillus psychrotolerans TaxID=191770 RepID=A0A511H181_9LACT|nr:MarR family winged helix-turn-helix transcriptional regulator [Marinilactibacillus psychrotolerans]TLQ08295.1 winged helix-turn-helix transcriptional regulator [Marinilactibacillus psychrotolerans]SDC62778.1 DNA-binding transcriptional regulator, MarR family [Marinilactibacillus psychrotolerans]SJN20755.1 Transcriptional regulator of fatty acid biosynthesis FabT [Marinilactibacillus psychrotolerans 42ea]GEL67276.1 MarR family transcriptional regulator [Marinilactibacillus psychrotolerans]GE